MNNKNNGKNTNNNNHTHDTQTRTVDREYYAHQETARNKWFNYSDPYYLENEKVEEYQENLAKKQQQMQGTHYESQQHNHEKTNAEQMGSTTNYAQYSQTNQYPSQGNNPFENTTPPEPIVDVESHVNLNTAPSFAGDHLYPGGYTRTQESGNVYTPTETYADSYNAQAKKEYQNQDSQQQGKKEYQEHETQRQENDYENTHHSGGGMR